MTFEHNGFRVTIVHGHAYVERWIEGYRRETDPSHKTTGHWRLVRPRHRGAPQRCYHELVGWAFAKLEGR